MLGQIRFALGINDMGTVAWNLNRAFVANDSKKNLAVIPLIAGSQHRLTFGRYGPQRSDGHAVDRHLKERYRLQPFNFHLMDENRSSACG